MAGILSKSQAKGVDFCGGYKNSFIIRGDLGFYMLSSDLHVGNDLTLYNIHPACQGGDHYFADTTWWYIIKGNNYRCTSDLTLDDSAVLYKLHPNFQGGDHYLCSYGYFYIIFQSKGVYRTTSDLTTDPYGVEYKLHANCKDGLYYWGTSSYFYLVKPKGDWGVQFHMTSSLMEDTYAETLSVHPNVLNFLPGGLALTHGPAFGKWELLKSIENNTTSLTYEEKIHWKLGFTKSMSSSIEHSWNISMIASYQSGTLTEAIAKYQFSLSTEFGGRQVNTEDQSWEDVTEKEEKFQVTLKPKEQLYVWQYKLGFGEEDVLFCRDMKFNNDPNPPTNVPLKQATI